MEGDRLAHFSGINCRNVSWIGNFRGVLKKFTGGNVLYALKRRILSGFRGAERIIFHFDGIRCVTELDVTIKHMMTSDCFISIPNWCHVTIRLRYIYSVQQSNIKSKAICFDIVKQAAILDFSCFKESKLAGNFK